MYIGRCCQCRVRPCSFPASDKLARGTKTRRTPWLRQAQSAIAVIGIDISKNSFHVVGLDGRGAIVLYGRSSWSGPNTLCQYVRVPDRHGGLRRCASSQSQAQGVRARCTADAGEVRATLFQRPEERCTPDKHNRLKHWEHEGVLDKMQARLDRLSDALTIRRQTVEHPFGTLRRGWAAALS